MFRRGGFFRFLLVLVLVCLLVGGGVALYQAGFGQVRRLRLPHLPAVWNFPGDRVLLVSVLRDRRPVAVWRLAALGQPQPPGWLALWP